MEQEIYTKYRKWINQANSGFLRDCPYGDLMEMLRHVERVRGHSIPMNFSCGECKIQIVQLFSSVEGQQPRI